jgi:HPt (histidine-containing phosphotransfer) domain-containing protein
MAKRAAKAVQRTEIEPAEAAFAEAGDDGLGIDESAEFIRPPTDLRRKVREIKTRPGDPDPVAAAEAALKRMEDSFEGWMEEETVRLVELWAVAERSGWDAEVRDEFHRAAHDIKGQAATLGYPIAGRVAASLCRLLETIEAPNRLPRELLHQHVLSVRAILAEQAREESSETARRLADRLEEVTEDYIGQIDHAA